MLKNKKINIAKLVDYGFIKNEQGYLYKTKILDNQFEMYVQINSKDAIKTKILDLTTNEEYVLHLDESISGNFIGQVRKEYEDILEDIINKCTDDDVFKADQTQDIIEFITNTYEDNLEFLWSKFPNNAVFRNKNTKKWYAAILSVKPKAIGKPGDNAIEIIDLHMSADRVNELVDGDRILPGYHMNKKYWITICLDKSVSNNQIKALIEESYANS